LPPAKNIGFWSLVAVLFLPAWLAAQAPFRMETGQAPPPAVSVGDYPPTYAGPGREPEMDLALAEIRIGLFIPTEGPREQEGQGILRGAQQAIQEANERGGYRGKPFTLVVRSDSQPWGRATNDLVKMIYEEAVVAIMTSSDRGASHLAEQVATKAQVPVLTFSNDPSLTQTNIPWIYRFAGDDSAQVKILAQYLFERRRLRNVFVLAVSPANNPAIGGTVAALKRLASVAGASVYLLPAMSGEAGDWEDVVSAVSRARPEAIVLWASAARSATMLRRLRHAKVSGELVVVTQDDPTILLENKDGFAEGVTMLWKAVPHSDTVSQGRSGHLGATADMGGRTAYDAVRVLLAGIDKAGPNRARLRDELARIHFKGLTGDISFDSLGNRLDTSCLGVISSGRFNPIMMPSGKPSP